jgi:hypothetical protein
MSWCCLQIGGGAERLKSTLNKCAGTNDFSEAEAMVNDHAGSLVACLSSHKEKRKVCCTLCSFGFVAEFGQQPSRQEKTKYAEFGEQESQYWADMIEEMKLDAVSNEAVHAVFNQLKGYMICLRRLRRFPQNDARVHLMTIDMQHNKANLQNVMLAVLKSYTFASRPELFFRLLKKCELEDALVLFVARLEAEEPNRARWLAIVRRLCPDFVAEMQKRTHYNRFFPHTHRCNIWLEELRLIDKNQSKKAVAAPIRQRESPRRRAPQPPVLGGPAFAARMHAPGAVVERDADALMLDDASIPGPPMPSLASSLGMSAASVSSLAVQHSASDVGGPPASDVGGASLADMPALQSGPVPAAESAVPVPVHVPVSVAVRGSAVQGHQPPLAPSAVRVPSHNPLTFATYQQSPGPGAAPQRAPRHANQRSSNQAALPALMPGSGSRLGTRVRGSRRETPARSGASKVKPSALGRTPPCVHAVASSRSRAEANNKREREESSPTPGGKKKKRKKKAKDPVQCKDPPKPSKKRRRDKDDDDQTKSARERAQAISGRNSAKKAKKGGKKGKGKGAKKSPAKRRSRQGEANYGHTIISSSEIPLLKFHSRMRHRYQQMHARESLAKHTRLELKKKRLIPCTRVTQMSKRVSREVRDCRQTRWSEMRKTRFASVPKLVRPCRLPSTTPLATSLRLPPGARRVAGGGQAEQVAEDGQTDADVPPQGIPAV